MQPEQDKSPFTSDGVKAQYAKIEPNGDIVEPIIEALDSCVFGQHDACAAVARRVAIAESHFVDPKRPLASVFMMGPTGTGKTEMSRALAEHLFKESWEERLLVVDCTQFAHEADISRFIGSSPQYVGYGDKGIITKEFLEQGLNIIVFDEVEKAHPAVWKLLLRVLDKGKMMVRAGSDDERYHANEEVLLFNNSYIFFTSNVGAAQIGEIQRLLASGTIAGETASERIKVATNGALKKLFVPMPEFLGRLDDIVVFQPLGDKQYRRIFDKVMREINQQLEDKPGTPKLSFTREFREYILSLVNKEYGAREIRRWLEREFIEPTVNINSSTNLENTMLIADYQNGRTSFYRKPLEEHKQSPQTHQKKEANPQALVATTIEVRPAVAPEALRGEQDAWRRVLGTEVDIQPLPASVTPEVRRNLERMGMELRFIPSLDLDTLEDLYRKDEESYLNDLQSRYPNWRRYELLDHMAWDDFYWENDHSVGRNLEKCYWEKVKDGDIDYPQLPGVWVAVESMPKPSYGDSYKKTPVSDRMGLSDRFNVSWSDAQAAIQKAKRGILSEAGLLSSLDVRMLETLEWNLLANREGWGATNTYEWTNTEYRKATYSSRVIAGFSVHGGAACVRWLHPGHSHDFIGFRLAIVLGS